MKLPGTLFFAGPGLGGSALAVVSVTDDSDTRLYRVARGKLSRVCRLPSRALYGDPAIFVAENPGLLTLERLLVGESKVLKVAQFCGRWAGQLLCEAEGLRVPVGAQVTVNVREPSASTPDRGSWEVRRYTTVQPAAIECWTVHRAELGIAGGSNVRLEPIGCPHAGTAALLLSVGELERAKVELVKLTPSAISVYEEEKSAHWLRGSISASQFLCDGDGRLWAVGNYGAPVQVPVRRVRTCPAKPYSDYD